MTTKIRTDRFGLPGAPKRTQRQAWYLKSLAAVRAGARHTRPETEDASAQGVEPRIRSWKAHAAMTIVWYAYIMNWKARTRTS